MTWGLVPVRIWERSSSSVTSRTQWTLFSMDLLPRIHLVSFAGMASWTWRSVIA
ncbi:hypothetical protein ACX27O_26970 [Micromonospora sp. SD19]|uniref:hypothetical protein n=1 Tax=Micromonospora sp. C97 TaxID=2824883 RepID=UPI001B36B573|nr:hypothetical protein [Micromonospora sp. C97]